MTFVGWIQIAVFSILILALTKPLGVFMYRVFEGEKKPLPKVFGPVERFGYRLMGGRLLPGGSGATSTKAWRRSTSPAACLVRAIPRARTLAFALGGICGSVRMASRLAASSALSSESLATGDLGAGRL